MQLSLDSSGIHEVDTDFRAFEHISPDLGLVTTSPGAGAIERNNDLRKSILWMRTIFQI